MGDFAAEGGARRNVGAVTYVCGGDYVAVAADEGVVAHICALLFLPVVVGENHAAPHVYPVAQGGVAYVCEVGHLTAAAQSAIFELHKVAYAAALPHLAAGADIAEGAKGAVRPY